MTVKDLKEHLKMLDDDLDVIVKVDKIQSSPNDRDMFVTAPLEDLVYSTKETTVILAGVMPR